MGFNEDNGMEKIAKNIMKIFIMLLMLAMTIYGATALIPQGSFDMISYYNITNVDYVSAHNLSGYIGRYWYESNTS